jgi:hypothetical protein
MSLSIAVDLARRAGALARSSERSDGTDLQSSFFSAGTNQMNWRFDMNKAIAAGAALLGFGLAAGSASALPASRAVDLAPAIHSELLIQVHGVHRRCELGRGGWHRSPAPGVRISCRPSRPPGVYWFWRCAGGDCGWWHRRERRWWR